MWDGVIHLIGTHMLLLTVGVVAHSLPAFSSKLKWVLQAGHRWVTPLCLGSRLEVPDSPTESPGGFCLALFVIARVPFVITEGPCLPGSYCQQKSV